MVVAGGDTDSGVDRVGLAIEFVERAAFAYALKNPGSKMEIVKAFLEGVKWSAENRTQLDQLIQGIVDEKIQR